MIEDIHRLGHDSFRVDGSTTVYLDPSKPSSTAGASTTPVTPM
jgi:hypothetical protein